MNGRRILAENKNYQVSHEFEATFLRRKAEFVPETKTEIVIGNFYGDPEAAVIDKRERFVIVVGCGMIIYHLSEPFEPFRYDVPTSQWVELFREEPNCWWIQSISQTADDIFRFTVDCNTKQGGVYELAFPDLGIRKLP